MPPEARAWATSAGAYAPGGGEGDALAASIVQPAPGSTLYLAPELDAQRMLVVAAVPPSATAVEFLVDGHVIGTGSADRPQAIAELKPGRHTITVRALTPEGVAVASADYEVVRG
jgi:hypothetical protein